MSNDDLDITNAIQASVNSFNPITWDFALPRVIPITLCIDAGEESSKLGKLFQSYAHQALEEFGYNLTHTWGPFEGSHFITIFGTSNEPEDGITFAKKVEQIAAKLTSRISAYDWKKAVENAGNIIEIAACVGAIVTVFAAAPAAITIGGFLVPPVVLQTLITAGSTVKIAKCLRNIFLDDHRKTKALEEGSRLSYNPPTEEGFIKLLKPLKFKKPGQPGTSV